MPTTALISLLQDRSFQFPQEIAQVAHLFHLDEKKLWEDIKRTPVEIKKAAACLEKVACDKHRRYFLQQLQKLDPSTDYQRRQYYWQELKAVNLRLQELEQIRQIKASEISG